MEVAMQRRILSVADRSDVVEIRLVRRRHVDLCHVAAALCRPWRMS
jgi:hypothetical protein